MSATNSPIPLGPLEDTAGQHRPERRDAAANRALILQTAERLFARDGVAQINMADIAAAAGVGKGTLYRRFANKGELCLALMDSQLTEFQEAILARLRHMAARNASYLEQLDVFLDALIQFTETHQPLLCEVQREGLFETDTDLTRPHFWQYMTVSGLLRAAANAGEISSEMDIAYVSDALLAPLKIDLFRFQREVRGFSLERISAGLRTLVAGLRLADG